MKDGELLGREESRRSEPLRHIDLTTPDTPPLKSTRVIGVSQAVARHNAAPIRFNYLLLAEILGSSAKEIKRFSKRFSAELNRSMISRQPVSTVARVFSTLEANGPERLNRTRGGSCKGRLYERYGRPGWFCKRSAIANSRFASSARPVCWRSCANK